MNRVLTLLLIGLSSAAADEQTAVATVQRMFDAMAHHDADTAKALFAPSATLVSVRPDGTAVTTPSEKWVERLGTSKDAWLERMWNPKVLEKGSLAVVWAEYDFHLNGKFSHCGIDSVSLLKSASGWKIASITYSTETINCAPSPLGPPTGLSSTIR